MDGLYGLSSLKNNGRLRVAQHYSDTKGVKRAHASCSSDAPVCSGLRAHLDYPNPHSRPCAIAHWDASRPKYGGR